jgi:hypothetical protein
MARPSEDLYENTHNGSTTRYILPSSFGTFRVKESPVLNFINCTSFRFILLLPGLALCYRRNSAVYIEEGVRVAGGNMIRRVKMLSRNSVISTICDYI